MLWLSKKGNDEEEVPSNTGTVVDFQRRLPDGKTHFLPYRNPTSGSIYGCWSITKLKDLRIIATIIIRASRQVLAVWRPESVQGVDASISPYPLPHN